MSRPIDFRLYLITDRAFCAPRPLDDVVREACAAGVRAVQLREKDLREDEILALATRLSAVAREHGAKLFVNARGLAELTSIEGMIDGVHFPDHPHVLNCCDSPKVIGRSVHSLDGATGAVCEGVDYLFFSPVFPPLSKVSYAPPQGLDALAEVARAVDVPVFALGGVTPERAAACLEAGAHGVAVIGAIMAADDVAAAVRRFEEEMGSL
jgi:thiamine-phosphate pyrophosphorylase